MRPLSPREVEVLQLVAEGGATWEVAESLGLSEDTVKSHLSRVYWKLEAANRAHAVAIGMRMGVVR